MALLTISPSDIEGVANIGTTYEIRLLSYPGLSKESFVGNGKGIVSYAKTLTADGQDAVLDLIPNEQITPDSVYAWVVPGQPPKYFTMPAASARLGDRVTQFLSAPPYQNPQRFNVTFNPSTRVLTFTLQGETGPAENFTVTLPVGGLNATEVATEIGEQVSQEHHALASTLLNDLFLFATPAYKTITSSQSRRVTALDEALVAGAESVLDIEGYDLILFENDDLFNLTSSTNSLGNNKRTYDLKIQGRASGDSVDVGRNASNRPLLQFDRTLARKARLRALTPRPLGLQTPDAISLISQSVSPWAHTGDDDEIPLAKIPDIPDSKLPADVARTTSLPSVSDWAETGNADPIPSSKLPNLAAGSVDFAELTTALRDVVNDAVQVEATSTSGTDINLYSESGKTALIQVGPMIDGRVSAWGLQFNTDRIPTSKLPNIPDSLIPTGVARDSEIETWAKTANRSTMIPDSKIPAGIARDTEVPLNATGEGQYWGTDPDAVSPYAATWHALPSGGTGGVTTGITRSQAQALIQPWARVGNTSRIPDNKLPTGLTRDTEVEGFAKTASSDQVPIAKIPSTVTRNDQVEDFAKVGNSADVPDAKIPGGITRDTEVESFAKVGNSADVPDSKLPSTAARTSQLPGNAASAGQYYGTGESDTSPFTPGYHDLPVPEGYDDAALVHRVDNLEDFDDALREFDTIADDRLITSVTANEGYLFPNPAVNLPTADAGRHIEVVVNTARGAGFTDPYIFRLEDLLAKTARGASQNLGDATSVKWVRNNVTFRLGRTSGGAFLFSSSSPAAYYITIRVATINVTPKVDAATGTVAGKITEDRVTALANAATPSLTAANVTVDTTDFGNNLTTAADTVQKVADQLDNINLSGGGATVPVPGAGDANQVATAEAAGTVKWEPITAVRTQTTTANFNGILSAADSDMQKVADTLDDKAQPKSEELDEIIAGILPDEWTISETVEVASVMSSVRRPANPENLNFGARNTDNFFRQNLWQVVKMPDSIPTADLGQYRLFIGDSDGSGNTVTPILLDDSTPNRVTFLETVAGFRYYSIAVADKPADQQLFIEEQHLLEAIADKWTPFDRRLLANVPATPKPPTGDAFPANPSVGDEFEILQDNTVPGLGLMTTATDSGSGVIGWSAGVGAYGSMTPPPAGIYAVGYRATIDQRISVASRLTTNSVNGIYIREIDSNAPWTLVPLIATTGHFRQSAPRAYAIESGKSYQVYFRNSSPIAYANRLLSVGIYQYSRAGGWVATPGQAAPWARQGQPEPRTLFALTVLQDGPSAGLTITASGSNLRSNFTAFNPPFDLDDAVNELGALTIEMIPTLSVRSDTQIGFDQSTDHPSLTFRFNGFTLAQSIRDLPNYASNNAASTIAIDDADIYRGTTKLGNISLHVAHNANNVVGYLLIYAGDTAGYSFSIGTRMEAIFSHNDGTASGLNEEQTDLRVTTLVEPYALDATASATKRQGLAELLNNATAESQRLQGSAIRSNTITPEKTTFGNNVLPSVSTANNTQILKVNSAGLWALSADIGLTQAQTDTRANIRIAALVRDLALKATSDASVRAAIATLMNAATQTSQRLGTAAYQNDSITPAKVSFDNRILPSPTTGNAGKIAKINSGGAWAIADDVGLTQTEVDARIRALVKSLGLAATSDAATRTAVATLMNAATQVGQRLGTAALQDDAVTPAKTSFENRILPAPGTGNRNKIAKINSSNQWALADEAPLPAVTAADDGDILTVVSGAWSKADPPTELLAPQVLTLPASPTANQRVTLVEDLQGGGLVTVGSAPAIAGATNYTVYGYNARADSTNANDPRATAFGSVNPSGLEFIFWSGESFHNYIFLPTGTYTTVTIGDMTWTIDDNNSLEGSFLTHGTVRVIYPITTNPFPAVGQTVKVQAVRATGSVWPQDRSAGWYKYSGTAWVKQGG